MSDIPATLTFVDPTESAALFRVVLWGAPGEGKSVGAASAPAPIVVLTADRPGAYRYARKAYPLKDIRETRYVASHTLDAVLTYLKDTPEVKTVIVDPVHNIVERLVDQAPKTDKGEPNYQAANKRFLGFIYDLRRFDVHVVLVAHERLSEGKGGDGKMYPQLGGPSLINKVLAEMDIAAHVERQQGQGDEPDTYWGQLKGYGNLVCKEATDVDLGPRRALDLTEWFTAATEDTSDLPWDPEESARIDAETAAAEAAEAALEAGVDETLSLLNEAKA